MTIIFLLFYSQASAQNSDSIKLLNFSYKVLPETYKTLITRIVDSSSANDTFNIQFATTNTVCNYNAHFEIEGDTLFLGVEIIDYCIATWADYHFSYSFSGVKKKYIIKYGEVLKYTTQEYEIFPEEFEIENGQRINYKDKFGLRQGLWKLCSNEYYFEGEYVDGKLMKGKDITYDEHRNKLQEEIWIDEYPIKTIVFDKEGNVIEEHFHQNCKEE